MSELINNSQARKEELKRIILALHSGGDPVKLKHDFAQLLSTVGASEIGQLEQELINEGHLDVGEISKLCDVHASVFEGSQQKLKIPNLAKGHPVQVFMEENRALEGVLSSIRAALSSMQKGQAPLQDGWNRWKAEHEKLVQVDKHYSRKENILFPYLEKNGVPGPSKVMWTAHDEIRAELKKVTRFLQGDIPSSEELNSFVTETVQPVLAKIDSMIFKEENILFPMTLEMLNELEWKQIRDQSDEIGFVLITPGNEWEPDMSKMPKDTETHTEGGEYLRFASGYLTFKELNKILNTLPVDLTFVGKDDTVRYFSQGPERIFARTPAIIGRNVENCHPQESVHVVAKIVEEFKAGKRDLAQFWLPFNGMYVYIVYYALRDENGEYMGVLEVTQNIKPLQEISGEKRILDPV